jgi:hypothetical protein
MPEEGDGGQCSCAGLSVALFSVGCCTILVEDVYFGLHGDVYFGLHGYAYFGVLIIAI